MSFPEPSSGAGRSQRPGIFTVSLDFELFWGMADMVPLDTSYRNVLATTRQEVIPRLLDRFSHHGVHTTWATVGYLFYDSMEELAPELPTVRPDYHNPALSSYRYLDDAGPDEAADPYRFGSSLVELIKATPGQEIGSHSFSHYYCLEPGAGDDSFAADLSAWVRSAARHGVEGRSLCFGRNQYSSRSVELVGEAGFKAYRGNEPSWLYRPRAGGSETLPRKALRYLDTYVPLTRHHCPDPQVIGATNPINVASSRFLRAYRHDLRLLEPLKLRRIAGGMQHAADVGGVYHLWWHPQDFAESVEENFALLERILETYARLNEDGRMISLSMGELAEHVTRDGRVHP